MRRALDRLAGTVLHPDGATNDRVAALDTPPLRKPTTLLELLFRFKVHPPEDLAETTDRHFQVVSHYRFPPFQIIGWSKTAVLAQKI